MLTIDEQLKYDLQLEYNNYIRACKKVRKNATRKHMIKILQERVHKQLPGCTTSSGYDGSMFVYLSPDHNITKDWMIFLDNNIEFIEALGKAREYKVSQDKSYGSYDYKWPEFMVYVNYSNGKCERVKIGTETETVTKDVYEVRCL